METTKNNSSELDNLSDVVGMIEEYLRRIRLRGKYPLQTELDLIGIAFEVGQIKSILREIKESWSINSEELPLHNAPHNNQRLEDI